MWQTLSSWSWFPLKNHWTVLNYYLPTYIYPQPTFHSPIYTYLDTCMYTLYARWLLRHNHSKHTEQHGLPEPSQPAIGTLTQQTSASSTEKTLTLAPSKLPWKPMTR